MSPTNGFFLKEHSSVDVMSLRQPLGLERSFEQSRAPVRAPAGNKQVERAEAWIEAHLSEPINVRQIARAVGVSRRSLEYTFQRERGYSPAQAVMRMRFERVRHALLHGDERASVTEIAAACCFTELGRFSVRYRLRYGESPSETLKRRRRAAGSDS